MFNLIVPRLDYNKWYVFAKVLFFVSQVYDNSVNVLSSWNRA